MAEQFKIDTKYDKEKYTKYSKQSKRVVYWLALLVMVVCNFLIFLVLIPLIRIINYIQLFVIVGAIGLIFGFIFNFLIRDIEHLEPKHHLFAGIFIPVISIINIYLLISIFNSVHTTPGSNTGQRTLITSIIYVLMFAGPYIFSFIKKKKFK